MLLIMSGMLVLCVIVVMVGIFRIWLCGFVIDLVKKMWVLGCISCC